ncbi:MAG: hypothetical protein Q9170_003497 [Blastenia crenularia]
MPGIEILPNSTSISAPGWAYVPDNGYDPSKAAIQPTGARKRAARTTGITGGDTTTRQNNATLKHLAELDKDNYKDVQIPVPARFKEKVGSKTKTTPNVRRILASQKTFANHLADEEAAIASQGDQAVPASIRASAPLQGPKASIGRRASTLASEPPSADDVQRSTEKPHMSLGISRNVTAEDPGSRDPLLRSYIPVMPSEGVMEALLAVPPLSYNAARAAPSVGKPQSAVPEYVGSSARTPMMKGDASNFTLEEARELGATSCMVSTKKAKAMTVETTIYCIIPLAKLAKYWKSSFIDN